eukprot:510215-Prorocentrum_minimum.AAC.1
MPSGRGGRRSAVRRGHVPSALPKPFALLEHQIGGRVPIAALNPSALLERLQNQNPGAHRQHPRLLRKSPHTPARHTPQILSRRRSSALPEHALPEPAKTPLPARSGIRAHGEIRSTFTVFKFGDVPLDRMHNRSRDRGSVPDRGSVQMASETFRGRSSRGGGV